MSTELAKIRILVVEDEDDARAAVVKILENSGHTAIGAADCKEALMLFDAQGGFDMVMTDLSLPGPSGWDVARGVKERSPDTPVVLLSGWDIDKRSEEIVKSGVSRILPKPVSVKAILQTISELVTKGGEGK